MATTVSQTLEQSQQERNSIPDCDSPLLPKHVGHNIIPQSSLLYKLLLLARKRNTTVINDTTNNIKENHVQFLSDVIHTRNLLLDRLDIGTRNKLLRGEEVYICLLCPAGYAFTVGFFAIYAVGAVVVPLSPALPLDEAKYFVTTSQADGILTSNALSSLGQDLTTFMQQSLKSEHFVAIDVETCLLRPVIPVRELVVSKDHVLNDEGAGLVIFTSGTTGPPKGAVSKRSFLYAASLGMVDWYDLSPKDVVLHGLPVHHITGIGVTILPFILSGACIEFQSGGFKAEQVWERWLRGGLTVFSGVPTMYQRLMQHFENHIVKLPSDKADMYVKAAQSFRIMFCGSSALPQPLQKKWSKLLNGRQILQRYGATESGCVMAVEPEDSQNPDGSVGRVYPGLEVKLSNGDEGEILIKSPYMFYKYLGNPTATSAAFDDQGYFRSGDIARREGDYYFIQGRASIDIIKSGGYKISALDIERGILGLEYVEEAIILGIEDEEYGQRVAAAVVVRNQNKILTLNQLRKDLRESFASYKLPTLLRVVPELPKNASGKVPKKKIKPELFPKDGHADVQIWTRTASKI